MSAMASLLKMLFRRDPSGHLQDGARKWARSELSDPDACAALASDARDIPPTSLDAEIRSWHPRDDFLNDRAYRLLVGVRDGAVPPIDSSKRERFAREEKLGRLPLTEAFELLAASYPELDGLATRARAGEKLSVKQQRPVLKRILDEDEHGRTAFGIVSRYLGGVARGKDVQTPMFDRPGGYGAHGTITLGSPDL
jgi:hypothetical protein